MDTEIDQVKDFLSSATAGEIVESLQVGHWIRRIEKLPEGEWPEAIENVPLDQAYPHKSDMTLRDKVRRIMAKKWRERRVHFRSNEYVYNHENKELERAR